MASELQASDLIVKSEISRVEKVKKSIQSIITLVIGHSSNLGKINKSLDVFDTSTVCESQSEGEISERDDFYGLMKIKQEAIIADLGMLNIQYAECRNKVELFLKEVSESERDYEIITLAHEKDGVIQFPIHHKNNEDALVETLTELLSKGDQMILKIELQQQKLIERAEYLLELKK